jgi:hypothetical protein
MAKEGGTGWRSAEHYRVQVPQSEEELHGGHPVHLDCHPDAEAHSQEYRN